MRYILGGLKLLRVALFGVKNKQNGRRLVGMAGVLIKAAARGESPNFIAYLIEEKGCDVNEKDENGCDALMYASFFGHFDVVETLLRYGADGHFFGGVEILC